MASAQVQVINSKWEIVNKIIKAPSVDAVNRKIDKLREKGELRAVLAWGE